MASLKDIAKKCGVSISTVSLIVNDKASNRGISRQTQDRVKEVIRQMAYVPNAAAKSLKHNIQSRFKIAIYWADDFRVGFFERFFHGLKTRMTELDWEIDIELCFYTTSKLSSDERLGENCPFNAVIVSNADLKDIEFIKNSSLFVPTIVFNRDADCCNTVSVSADAAGDLCAKHLKLCGITEVMAVVSSPLVLGMKNRRDAFIRNVSKLGVSVKTKAISSKGYGINEGVSFAKELIKQKKLPQALYCDTETIAHGISFELRRHGISIPKDIQIIAIGAGNLELANCISPSITLVTLPLEDLGMRCVDLIKSKIGFHSRGKEHIEVMPVLIQGDSTSPAKKKK